MQLRNLHSLRAIVVDPNITAVFPAPLRGAIPELGASLTREATAAARDVTVAATDGEVT